MYQFDEICGLLGYYAASCGNCLTTFRDNGSVRSSRVKSPFLLGLYYKFFFLIYLLHFTFKQSHLEEISFTIGIAGITVLLRLPDLSSFHL
jgi:hypothetical protein